MALFNNNKKDEAPSTKENMITRLCSHAYLDGDAVLAARREIRALADASREDYLKAAQALRDSITDEIRKRSERWAVINQQKDELLQREAATETALGLALVEGRNADVAKAEEELSKIHEEIAKVDARLRIFENATFRLSGEQALKGIEEKAATYHRVMQECGEIFDALEDEIQKQMDAFDEKNSLYKPDYYPACLESEPDFKIPEDCKLGVLRHLVSDELKIGDLLKQ